MPGDVLLHPLVVIALLTVAANDLYLKVEHPGFFSGKLSDFGALLYFPLFAVAVVEAGRWALRRRPWQLTERSVGIAVAAVGVVFTLIKVSRPFADLWRSYVGYVVWPGRAAISIAAGDGWPAVAQVGVIEDPTDLVALPALAVAALIGRRVLGKLPERR
ncbi:MAG: hypothetical protein GY812_14030 [Actinomycetia bacterium]|nr:hypothetical protein [Actinomycetes bacterium]